MSTDPYYPSPDRDDRYDITDDYGVDARVAESTLPGPIPESEYGPERVNVAVQERDPESLLSWMRLLIESYRACPGWPGARYAGLDAGNAAVLAHRCNIEGGTSVAVHNFGADRRRRH